jgi:glycogen debranching enzyme
MAEARSGASVATDGEPPHPHSVQPGRESLDDGVRVIKDGEGFAVFDRHGDAVPGRSSHGLYHDGTRHLSMLILSIAGCRPLLLKSTIHTDNVLLAIDLTNPDCPDLEIEADTVHVFRAKVLRDGTLHERLRITNHGMTRVRLPVTFRLGADFVDLFEVRGSHRARRGKHLEPKLGDTTLRFGYVGLDDVVRITDVTCCPRPTHVTAGAIELEVELEPKAEVKVELAITCAGSQSGIVVPGERATFDEAYQERKHSRSLRRARCPRIHSSVASFDRWIDRSMADVYMMLSDTGHGAYPYAGVPWYSTVFGRDGILTALSMLWADPLMARGVLHVLAATQAAERDDVRDAQPGKIVHELRTGEMAALGEIPFGRYYGTVDATPLFVVLAGAYLERTGDLHTLRQLWPHIEQALGWVDANASTSPSGFVSYAATNASGLVQQGWKDSTTSVFDHDGRLVDPPIALCEVQGYVYAARRAAATIARALGNEARAHALDEAAEGLRARFEQAFWLPELGTYALALDGDGQPCRVWTSNPGHCLWSGIASPERAAQVGAMLLDPRMFSGWGVRTLATHEARYNPMSYHNGSVWPHDTALCAAGLARYGMTDGALAILSGLHDASSFMDLHRMPELMCGFARKDGQGPTMYPVACSPQAWAAAAPMLILASCLGLTVDGARRTARVVTPALPTWIDWIAIDGLAVGDATVDLRFARAHGNGVVEVEHVVHGGQATVDVVRSRGRR